MIKLVAFDAGWVLFRPHNWELLHQKGFTEDEGYWLFREGLGRTSDWVRHQFKKGKSARQVISVLKKYYPQKANLLNRVQPVMRRLIEKDVISNIRLGNQLQKAGYLVEIWSDNGLGDFQKNTDYQDSEIGLIPELSLNCPLYKKYPSVHIDLKVPAFYSKDLGVKKENPEFFKKVLKAHSKIKPSEIIFVEDRPQNIYAAKSMGIECIQFVMNGIEREKVMGVPVARTTKELAGILHRKGIR